MSEQLNLSLINTAVINHSLTGCVRFEKNIEYTVEIETGDYNIWICDITYIGLGSDAFNLTKNQKYDDPHLLRCCVKNQITIYMLLQLSMPPAFGNRNKIAQLIIDEVIDLIEASEAEVNKYVPPEILEQQNRELMAELAIYSQDI